MEGNSDQGVLIVIEGVDGAGNQAQCVRLQQRLTAAGYEVIICTLPQYDQPSGHFVRSYAQGAYGDPNGVGPYTASLFFALDRYEAAIKIREALTQGKIVLVDQYVGSTMALQGTKFKHAEERRGYFIWLDNLEFEMLHTPRPDIGVVLRLPAEATGESTRQAIEVYDDMCQLFPRDFQRIDCARDSQLLDIDTIQDIIWQKIEPLLPSKRSAFDIATAAAATPTATSPPTLREASTKEDSGSRAPIQQRPEGTYVIPSALSGDLRDLYCDIMDRILALRSEIAALLVDHTDPAREQALRSVLPVAATQTTLPETPTATGLEHVIRQLTKELLPAHYADTAATVRLTSAWPRNELDLAADIVFGVSDLPLATLQQASAQWPYEVKLKLLEAYLESAPARQAHTSVLSKLHYTWDITSDYASLLQLQAAAPHIDLEHQALTPRYGYDLPTIIEEADVTEQYETCFELSLQLHSSLQEAGYEHEAQFATLLGHKVRAKLSHSAPALLDLFRTSTTVDAQTQAILQKMHEKIAEVHPIIGELDSNVKSTTIETL